MRIEIDICVAYDYAAHKWLNRILNKIYDGWHIWDTTSHSDPCAFEATTWICSRGTKNDWVHELLIASIQRGAWGFGLHNRRMRVTTCPSEEYELKPEDAARFAEERLCILVENEFSDGAFVERIVDELDKPLSRYWQQPGNPVRIYGLGGSGQMPQAVLCRVQGKLFRPRLVAIIDSDRKAPCAQESKKAQELRETCEEHDVPCWVLAKREAENYIPLILLTAWKPNDLKHARMVDAWDKLSDDQKNFFDMKKGLPKRLSDTDKALFQGVSEADIKVLIDGFGTDVHKCWTYLGVKARPQLRIRSQGDLKHGITLIYKEV